MDIFIETNLVLDKLDAVIAEENKLCSNYSEAQDLKVNGVRNQAIDAALGWCNTYKTKLQNSGS